MEQSPDDPLLAAFARALRRLRQGKNLSQQELARQADRSMQYISLLESCRYQPTLKTMGLLSAALEMTLTELMREIEDEEKNMLE